MSGSRSRHSTMGDRHLGHEAAVVCLARFVASRPADIARPPDQRVTIEAAILIAASSYGAKEAQKEPEPERHPSK